MREENDRLERLVLNDETERIFAFDTIVLTDVLDQLGPDKNEPKIDTPTDAILVHYTSGYARAAEMLDEKTLS